MAKHPYKESSMNKEVVKEIEQDKYYRVILRTVTNLLDIADDSMENLKELALNTAGREEVIPDEHIDFWNLVEIRATGILEKMVLLKKQLKGEEDA